MPTLKEVAARAGVSYQTVSKVLNGQLKVASETEQRIFAAAQGLSYRPNQLARNMRQQRSRMIGYSWEPGRFNQVNNILDAFLSSMVLEAEAAGYHLLPFPNRDGAAMIDAYRDLIDTGRVDGFVLSSVNYSDPRIQFLSQRGFPFVAFGRSNSELAFPFVDVDGAAGQRAVVEHLLAFAPADAGKVTAAQLPERMGRLVALGDLNADNALDRAELQALVSGAP